METKDLDFKFPQELIATEPSPSLRAMMCTEDGIRELDRDAVLGLFEPGDLLVINDTQVSPLRVFSQDPELEILFLKDLGDREWEVLFPARQVNDAQIIHLPDGVEARLKKRGLPQVLRLSRELDAVYFQEFGELALPPYIQQARGERHSRPQDREWYQTAWAKNPGSCAAPTASLHFDEEDLKKLRDKGVHIAHLTLHVGIGTFLPVKSTRLEDHSMHQERVIIPKATADAVARCKAEGHRVFALGTTVTRSLESWAHGLLTADEDGVIFGETDLFIQPGFEFKAVDVLMTNFHQPQSTLMALVVAFADLYRVRSAYEWAIERRFRLFSYGDLSIWA